MDTPGADRPRRWAGVVRDVLSVVVALVLGLAVLAVVGLVVAVEGGPGAIWLNIQPAPNQYTPALVQQRADARAAIRPALEVLDSSALLDPGPETAAAGCTRGQNNFKVHEGYKHVCTVTLGRFYGWDGCFEELARRLHAEFLAAGWHPDYDGGLPDLADQYATGHSRYESSTPGVSPSPIGFGLLWGTNYTNRDETLTVRLDFANSYTNDFHLLDYATGRASGESWSETGDAVAAGAAVGQILRASDGVLLATVEREYYRVEG
ncbi:MAG: hypothetical protein QM779_17350 [Propionicimonas sp.]|uniref:hypothetical protein n=1 Tax=Propionicimonas sp. TaxID=1955623 RepID=UPI003D1059A1